MNKDTIYRQAPIDVADSTDYTGLAIEDVKKVTDEVVKGLKQLPSAQPESCEDAISRKDCLHELSRMMDIDGFRDGPVSRTSVECMLKSMPTIKPEPSNCSEFPNNWIPCSERLPEMHTDVLTFDTYGNIWICSLIFTGRNNEACWEDDYGYLHNFDERIAWMPLPSPYQSESEE